MSQAVENFQTIPEVAMTQRQSVQAATHLSASSAHLVSNQRLGHLLNPCNQFQEAQPPQTPISNENQVRHNLTALELEPIPVPFVETPEIPSQIGRTSIPWDIKGVKELAVHVLFTIRYWDLQARKTMEVMKEREKAVQLFVENLSFKLGITLTKTPVFGTIENGVKKTLKAHKTKRNKEKNKITGGGDDDGDEVLNEAEFYQRQKRDRFYDTMVEMQDTFQAAKAVRIIIKGYVVCH